MDPGGMPAQRHGDTAGSLLALPHVGRVPGRAHLLEHSHVRLGIGDRLGRELRHALELEDPSHLGAEFNSRRSPFRAPMHARSRDRPGGPRGARPACSRPPRCTAPGSPSSTPRLIVSPDVSRIRSSTGLAAAPSERSEGLANEKNASPSCLDGVVLLAGLSTKDDPGVSHGRGTVRPADPPAHDRAGRCSTASTAAPISGRAHPVAVHRGLSRGQDHRRARCSRYVKADGFWK